MVENVQDAHAYDCPRIVFACSFARQGLTRRQPHSAKRGFVIDNFSLALTHGLLLLLAWRLLFRADLDSEPPPPPDEVSAPKFGGKSSSGKRFGA
jgi:hypothetical protein